MATTFTVTEPAPGDTLYTYSALARNDTAAAINVSAAKRIVVQALAGTLDSDTLAIEGSLDGTNWGPIYPPDAVSLTGIPAVAAGFTGSFAASASGQLAVQPTYWIRARVVTGGGGPAVGVKLAILVRTL